MAQRGTGVNRQTVDLSEFPDLVVIYLGMRVRNVRGLVKLLRTGRQIQVGVLGSGQDLSVLLHEGSRIDARFLQQFSKEMPQGVGIWHDQ